jgi:glycosyltransferase involved in cell wall biosynthesis
MLPGGEIIKKESMGISGSIKVLAVIVTPPTFNASGGVEAGLQLSRALVDKVNIEVAIMAQHTRVTKQGALTVREFASNNLLGRLALLSPRPLTSMLWRNRGLTQYISERQPDIVHIHNPHPPVALWKICHTCLDLGIPYVMSGHGFVETANFSEVFNLHGIKKQMAGRLVTRPFLKSVRQARMIFLTSPQEAQFLLSLGISKERQAIVTNGVDPYYFEAASPDLIAEMRQRFAMQPEIPAFLFVGNHTINKGIDLVLDAMHMLKVPCKAIIAGSIRSQAEHKDLCQRHGVAKLGDRVVFTDFISKEELRAIYQAADCLIFPTRADTLPLVILEAMAARLPVISTKVGGIPYQVDESSGILLEPNDAAAVAQAITELAQDKERRVRLGQQGYARLRERFDWDKSASVAAALYSQIANETRISVNI